MTLIQALVISFANKGDEIPVATEQVQISPDGAASQSARAFPPGKAHRMSRNDSVPDSLAP